MGVISGTISGEYKASFLGTKARERNRLAKIEECKSLIAEHEDKISKLEQDIEILTNRKEVLDNELEKLPK